MSINITGAGTITTGGVAQSLMGPSSTTQWSGYQIQNTSANPMYIEDSGAAATTASILVAAGTSYNSPPGCTPNKGLSLFCATGASTFVAKAY